MKSLFIEGGLRGAWGDSFSWWNTSWFFMIRAGVMKRNEIPLTPFNKGGNDAELLVLQSMPY